AFHTILVLFLPLTMLIIRSGQNSFLTGGLIGLTCLLALRQSRWSGVPLGLMAIKPHLALGVGIWSLLDRRWGMAVQSFAVISIFAALATLVFGTGIWAAAFGGDHGDCRCSARWTVPALSHDLALCLRSLLRVWSYIGAGTARDRRRRGRRSAGSSKLR
ncbi:DUF2029 domain-containing protein, partial [Sulfitobacter sp. M220]|uniref:glycosyltransferase family 87 protein n=1 Tax=Sulfitobacter sp. M220 TaxID=2675333 RepID=UPI001F34CABA